MEQTTRGKDFYANFRVRSRPAPPALRRVAVLPRLTAPLCAPRCPRPPMRRERARADARTNIFVRCCQVVLGDGAVAMASRDNHMADLYHAIPGTLGSLGPPPPPRRPAAQRAGVSTTLRLFSPRNVFPRKQGHGTLFSRENKVTGHRTLLAPERGAGGQGSSRRRRCGW